MSSSSSDGIEVPSDYVPPGVRYLLNEWHPRPLLTLEEEDGDSSMLPPRSTTVHTISTTTHDTGGGRTAKNASTATRRTGTKNRATRRAAFYDKHIADHLILLHVKRLDSLVDSIAGTVDQAIKDAYKQGPLPADDSDVKEKRIRSRTDRSLMQILREDGVAEYYNNLTALFCLPVASTLALHPTLDEWTSRLHWTKQQNKAGWAIADGVLVLDPMPKADNAELMALYRADLEHVYPDIRENWGHLRRIYPNLAIWEIKSLTVGDAEVMEGIALLSVRKELFRWKRCIRDCGRRDHKNVCATHDKWHPGFDALRPQWKLDIGDSVDYDDAPSSSRQSHRLRARPGALEVTPSGSRMPPESDSSLSPRTPLHSEDGRNSVSGESSEGKKRKLDETEEASDQEADELVTSYSGGKGKGMQVMTPKKKPGKGKQKKKNHDDESYEDSKGGRREVNAQSFLQQAWAQSVRTKSTILVLHSGNHEFIGIRHRSSQTLYISHLIVPHDCQPSYGKIQVGIYIAAIRDALDRVKQYLKAEAEGKVVSRDSAPRGDQDDQDNQPESSRNKRRKKDSTAKDGAKKRNPAPANTMQKQRDPREGGSARKSTRAIDPPTPDQTANRNVVFMHFCYGVYASPCPATFVRKTESPSRSPSPEQDTSHRPEESMDIMLTSEIRPGSTGIVHIGKMEVEPFDQCVQVAVKLAFSEDDKATLEHEHRIYSHLRSNGVQGIPYDFGLFVDEESVDDGEGPYALIMSFAGNSLYHQGLKNVVPSVKTSLLETLKAIHEAGVTHRDIRLTNLCSMASGQAFIIDFSHATQHESQSQKVRKVKGYEIAEIQELLGIDTSAKPISRPPTRHSARLEAKAKKKLL